MPTWLNEPPFWESVGNELRVRTGPSTDFWNNTFYGFRHDNGHCLATPVTGDFSSETRFSADYRTLYDQAGLMLRVDARNWLKAGIEFTDGRLHFSVVVTRDDQSDWSVTPLADAARHGIDMRLTRHGEALRIQVQEAGEPWRLVRLAFLAMPETVDIGPMCCSPLGDKLEVTFSRFTIGEPISRELHEDTAAAG